MSYAVVDLGKPSVPVLPQVNQLQLKAIRRYVPLTTLRFATVRGDVIFFDAKYGPCFGAAGGYRVLNLPCDARYEPGENPNVVFAAPGGCGPPQPWDVPSPRSTRYYPV